jgi:hypothetical protein
LKNKTGDKGQITDKAGGTDKLIFIRLGRMLVRGVKLNARQRKVTVARTNANFVCPWECSTCNPQLATSDG